MNSRYPYLYTLLFKTNKIIILNLRYILLTQIFKASLTRLRGRKRRRRRRKRRRRSRRKKEGKAGAITIFNFEIYVFHV